MASKANDPMPGRCPGCGMRLGMGMGRGPGRGMGMGRAMMALALGGNKKKIKSRILARMERVHGKI